MNKGSQPGFKELRSLWASRVGEGLTTVLCIFLFSSLAVKPILQEHGFELKFTLV